MSEANDTLAASAEAASVAAAAATSAEAASAAAAAATPLTPKDQLGAELARVQTILEAYDNERAQVMRDQVAADLANARVAFDDSSEEGHTRWAQILSGIRL